MVGWRRWAGAARGPHLRRLPRCGGAPSSRARPGLSRLCRARRALCWRRPAGRPRARCGAGCGRRGRPWPAPGRTEPRPCRAHLASWAARGRGGGRAGRRLGLPLVVPLPQTPAPGAPPPRRSEWPRRPWRPCSWRSGSASCPTAAGRAAEVPPAGGGRRVGLRDSAPSPRPLVLAAFPWFIPDARAQHQVPRGRRPS